MVVVVVIVVVIVLVVVDVVDMVVSVVVVVIVVTVVVLTGAEHEHSDMFAGDDMNPLLLPRSPPRFLKHCLAN